MDFHESVWRERPYPNEAKDKLAHSFNMSMLARRALNTVGTNIIEVTNAEYQEILNEMWNRSEYIGTMRQLTTGTFLGKRVVIVDD